MMGGYDPCVVQLLRTTYRRLAEKIRRALEGFRQLGRYGREEDIFAELVFCLLTPQSKARACWAAVERLRRRGLLLSGPPEAVMRQLKGVRFPRVKAQRVVEVRRIFSRDGRAYVRPLLEGLDPPEAREWLVGNVVGLGYKEASHFLRNIGRGEDLAILDRHVLKNLQAVGAIKQVPGSLSRKAYLDIEEAARRLAGYMDMTLGELDLLLWARETGEVFK